MYIGKMYLFKNHLICLFDVLIVHQCITIGYSISHYCRFAFFFPDVLQVLVDLDCDS